ncbi:MAG: ABC transporter ATP-binding protein [Lachnospiraceae bacterium]|nr:ABC transporter ATP-binding protein [Lachnospiraceae bacterium]
MSVLLEAKNVSKHFGGLKAVNDVSMNINKGEIFGIIGPNGAGKTTFFNVCSGIYAPTSGGIALEGKDISGFAPEKIARLGMARTFQNIQLFKYMTVLENVKIGFHIKTKTKMFDALLKTKKYREDEKLADEKGMQLLEYLGLEKLAATRAGNLAYGMQRKVEIARALATDPHILLLDEPAAGMNPNETVSLSEFIKKINGDGYTVAVIEHDMKFVMRTCHRIMVLNFGEKICEGTPETVQQDKLVNEAYFGEGRIARGEVMADGNA